MEPIEIANTSRPQREPVPALRIVHLAGGLRAIDLNQDKVWIEVTPEYRLANFPTPPYPQLYQALQQGGFRPIGVDFLVNHAFSDGAPPDWEVFRGGKGVYAMTAERAWSGVRYAASKSGNATLETLSSKTRTYLRLVPMRLRQLSEAYNLSLAQAVSKPTAVELGNLFDNEWTRHIDAAIHAFLADAGALRDVLSETIWRTVLGNDNNEVSSLSGLLKNTKSENHPLVRYVQASAKDGWLFGLSDLRNHIVHVAPVADSQEHHMCELRALKGPTKTDIPSLHLALLEGTGSVRKPANTFVDYSNEEAIKASLEIYLEYVKTSRDALDVCEEFCFQLVELSMQIKWSGAFEEREMVVTADDMVGPPTFY
jgi:hypothetical protein